MRENTTDDAIAAEDLPPMFRAAAWACAFPMVLGFIGLFFGYAAGVGLDVFALPTFLCFTFGTPLVAWLSCRALVRRAPLYHRTDFDFLDAWPKALKYSFLVHFFGFLTTFGVFCSSAKGNMEDLLLFSFLYGGFINAVLFVIVTLPLSMFCAAIFASLYSATDNP